MYGILVIRDGCKTCFYHYRSVAIKVGPSFAKLWLARGLLVKPIELACIQVKGRIVYQRLYVAIFLKKTCMAWQANCGMQSYALRQTVTINLQIVVWYTTKKKTSFLFATLYQTWFGKQKICIHLFSTQKVTTYLSNRPGGFFVKSIAIPNYVW